MKKLNIKPIHWGIISIVLILIIGLNIDQKSSPRLQDNTPSGYSGLAFTLQSNKGDVSLSDFQGKWVFLYVGYTFCPDVCPTNLGSLSQAYQQLSDDEKSKIQIMFISVDPDRDSPQRMAEYSKYFDMNMIGLTGKTDNLDELVKAIGAAYRVNKHEGKHYSVDHSAYTYVISPDAKLMEQIPHGTDAQNFLIKIKQIISNNNKGSKE